MGCKANKCLIGILLLSFLFKVEVKAESTASQLYDFFNIEYTLAYPEGVLETINAYTYAQKYEVMHRYVDSATYDVTLVHDRIKNAQLELESVESELDKGFSLSRESIYQLESRYEQLVSYIADEESRLVAYEVNYKTPENANIPSYEEYVEACNIRAEVDTHSDIGSFSVPMEAPVVSSWLIDEYDKSSVTFKVSKGTSVNALWNGEVLSVSDNKLVVSCHSGILIGYDNMLSIHVKEGDTVYQGQTIGTAESNLRLKLSLNGNFVNVCSLFIEE